MDSVTVSRRNRKTNKENYRPVFERRPVVKRDKQPAAPFQVKGSSSTQVTSSKSDARYATATQKKVKTFLKDGGGAAATEKQPARHQAILREQVGKDNKITDEIPGSLATAPSKLGVYKGKVVQSKIGAIWKTSTAACTAETKTTTTTNPSTIKAKIPNVKNNVQSTSAVAARRQAVQRPAQVGRSAVTGRVPAHPPARPVHSKITHTAPRNHKKTTVNENSKPSIIRTEKVNKPASSNLSQYRLTIETAEERRAKLAGWLASKGKTLKRPPMATAAASKVSVKSKPNPKVRPQPAELSNTRPRLGAEESDHSAIATAAQSAQKREATVMTTSQTPAIMNTTLDLLENSDADLPVEPQDKIDDIVMNLCDALEAMPTPSGSVDEPPEMKAVRSDVTSEDESDGDQIENKTPKDVSDQLQVEQKEEESDEDVTEEETEDKSEDETEDESEDEWEDEAVQSKMEDAMDGTPKHSASVVKYNVKTTPYLQSVKKTIDGETSTSVSRRKSNIKDLKFLTPVRRSCRIERKSSHLPTMLLDHDPCVTSLAELVKLDDDPNAYIYRKNPALAENLPDL